VRKKDRASCFVGVADGGAGNDLGMLGSVAGEAAGAPEMHFPLGETQDAVEGWLQFEFHQIGGGEAPDRVLDKLAPVGVST
jgi:hypothetical protein